VRYTETAETKRGRDEDDRWALPTPETSTRNLDMFKQTIAFCVSLALAGGALAPADTFRIEIDWMGNDTDGHDHMPDQLVLDAVIQMFACQGHTLIIDLSNEVPHMDLLTGDPGADCGNFWTYTGATNTYRNIRNANRDQGAGWHYCIFAHQYRIDADPDNPNSGCVTTSSSGRANGGDAFIVTLGGFSGQTGTLFEQAATLAHEFGHNLGLGHAGSMDSGVTTPYVQNLPSVMSYTYQLGGVRTTLGSLGFAPDFALFKEIDFSHGRMCSLNENSLSEPRGTLMLPVDFNCDNAASSVGVVQDLGFRGNGMGSNAAWCGEVDESRTLLVDYNEWANLVDGAGLRGAGSEGPVCITFEEWQKVQEDFGNRGGPPLEIEACITGRNAYLGTALPTEDGRCVQPYDSVQQAHAAMPLRSVFYLTPRTYNEVGTTTLNRRGIWSCNTGTARIE
jgi:Peptidase M66